MVNAIKKQKVTDITNSISTNEIVILLNHKVLLFKNIEKARRMFKEVKIIKFKNRLLKIAIEQKSKCNFEKDLKNENLIILSNDLFEAAKAVKFLTGIENVNFINGQFNSYELSKNDIKFISTISSKEQLISSVFSGIVNLIGSTHNMLDAIIKEKETANV